MLSRKDLHPYQVKGTKYIKDQDYTALWWEMGLGKTATVLTALDDLIHAFEANRVLIIAPLLVAKSTWEREKSNWSHLQHLNIASACGLEKQRLAGLAKNAVITTINPENVVWLTEYYGDEWPFDTVVIDEADKFKSPSSKRFKALKKKLMHICRVIELTGTPSPNGLLDVWSQLYLLDRGERLGKSFGAYQARYFESDYMGYKWTLRPGSEKKILDQVSDLCLTLKAADYIDMPDRIVNNPTYIMDDALRGRYEDFERDCVMNLAGDDMITADTAAVMINKLQQFANGFMYHNEDIVSLHKHKLELLESVVSEAAGKPILVAYQFKADKAAILKHFKKAVALTEDNIDAWNRGEIPILVAHPASAGHGLNLQAGGNRVVWFGPTWNLGHYLQFNARLARQGQKEDRVFITHLIAEGTVDELILDALGSKDRAQQRLIDGVKALTAKHMGQAA